MTNITWGCEKKASPCNNLSFFRNRFDAFIMHQHFIIKIRKKKRRHIDGF